jgi:hypothetical protein
MRFLCLLSFLTLVVAPSALSQWQNNTYQAPLDINLTLAGNFGEFRSSHFHTGLDFKTLGITGLNVFCSKAGYIARIKIEPSGFGKSIYVVHPDGTTSVYGHLEAFRNDIDLFCKQNQYNKKSFNVDLFPSPNQFVLKKGERFAYSGDAGGSAGPHLHYELRQTKTQQPINPIQYYLEKIKDTISPTISSIRIYPLSDSSVIEGKNEAYSIEYSELTDKAIIASGKIGIGVEYIDFSNESNSKIGAYRSKLFFDNQLIYEQTFDRLSFAESKYVNAVIDYKYYQESQRKIARLFVLPNGKVITQHNVINKGMINISDTSSHSVRIEIYDDHLNKNQAEFTIKGAKYHLISKQSTTNEINWDKYFYIKEDGFSISITKKTLFENASFRYNRIKNDNFRLSPVYEIINPSIPIYSYFKLSIKPAVNPPALSEKLLLLHIDDNGNVIRASGSYTKGEVSAWVRNFGKYTIGVDTIPPSIIPVFEDNPDPDFSKWRFITFILKDDLSGVDYYKATIDGKWQLFEFDAKTNAIIHDFSYSNIPTGQKHSISLEVADKKGNISKYSGTFYK